MCSAPCRMASGSCCSTSPGRDSICADLSNLQVSPARMYLLLDHLQPAQLVHALPHPQTAEDRARTCQHLSTGCIACRSSAQLAALHRGAHWKPWSRLLPPGGGASSAAGQPPKGAATLEYHDIQGRAALQVPACIALFEGTRIVPVHGVARNMGTNAEDVQSVTCW